MDTAEATSTLLRAEQMRSRARHDVRWYARYLTAYALASLVIASLFAFVHGRTGALALTAVWLVFLAALTVWQVRKRTVLVGTGRIHGLVIGAWAVLWSITVLVGSTRFVGQPAWWIPCGVAMAIPPLVGAVVVRRRVAA